jgi:hypothetical protein
MHVLSEDSPANGLCLLWCGGIGFEPLMMKPDDVFQQGLIGS